MWNVEYILGGRWQVFGKAVGLTLEAAAEWRAAADRCGMVTRMVRA